MLDTTEPLALVANNDALLRALAHYRRTAIEEIARCVAQLGAAGRRRRTSRDGREDLELWTSMLYDDFAQAGPNRNWGFPRTAWPPLQVFRNTHAFDDDVRTYLDELADLGDALDEGRTYTVDGRPCTLAELRADNPADPASVLEIVRLRVGDEVGLGGQGCMTVRRVS